LGDEHEAQDVVQEVFAGLSDLAARFDPARGSVGDLLVAVARRRALDRRRREPWLVVEDAHEVLERPRDPVGLVSERLEHDELSGRLARLPLLHRQVVWLRYALGLPLAEVAEVLGRDHAHVRQVHRRALRALTPALAASVR